MIAPKIRFLFDVGSPNAYLCHRVIPRIEARHGIHIDYVPGLLGGVFKLTNNKSPIEAFASIANKLRYGEIEIDRFCSEHAITDFSFSPFFPLNSLMLMRGAIAANDLGVSKQFIDTIFHYIWSEPRKIDDITVLHRTLRDEDLDAGNILARANDPAVKQRLIDNTQDAVDEGVFGVPTFFVNDEIYFGKESLRAIDDLLRGPRP